MAENRIVRYLRRNYDGSGEPPIHTNPDNWTLADLFIRQYLNNMSDGFGCNNVWNVFNYLVRHKDELIEFDMISEEGWNNSGYPLWTDYEFDKNFKERGKKASREGFDIASAMNQAIHDMLRQAAT